MNGKRHLLRTSRALRASLLALLLGLLTFTAVGVRPAAAQSGNQYYVIELVNNLRAEYGLPPYQVNPALMAAAQAHSEWAASIGAHSHTGAGGSTPKDRAIAAGYGGGAAVRVSENIYWGTLATADSAVEWWRNSPIHFQGMTSTNYVDIGAGVAYGDAGGFFTLNFGAVIGSAPAATSAAPASGTPLPVYVVEPVEVAEAGEDGSIVHTVGDGQTLWAISAAYDVPLSEIMALNRLTESSIIQPGDEIVIIPSPIETAAAADGPLFHTVGLGQTLFEIALTYGVNLDTLIELNGLTESALIFPGDEILIRPGENWQPTPRGPLMHTVQAGQTPIEIALIYGVDLQTLLAQNGLTESSLILPGDELLILTAEPTWTPAPTVSPTPAPTRVAQAAGTVDPTATPAAGEGDPPTREGLSPVIWVVIASIVVGGALLALGLGMRPRSGDTGS